MQLAETKQALERHGVEVAHSTEMEPDLHPYDLVHLFNITRFGETLAQYRNAVRQGKPVALSPIYWNMEEFIIEEEGRGANRLLEWWRDGNPFRREILAMASVLLPNAEGEMDLITRDFGVTKRYHVVPNAADPRFAEGRAQDFISRHGIRDFILCVGRISPRKNQLSLVRALRDLELPLVFIGAINDPFYLESCKKEAGRNTVFLSHMSHRELSSAYAAARVHVLPSWYETPGLASIEAALAGCNIVSTDRGTAREYFGDDSWYCNPKDIDSLRRAVLDAYRAGRSGRLKEIALKNYSWERAAEETLKAYREVLSPALE